MLPEHLDDLLYFDNLLSEKVKVVTRLSRDWRERGILIKEELEGISGEAGEYEMVSLNFVQSVINPFLFSLTFKN